MPITKHLPPVFIFRKHPKKTSSSFRDILTSVYGKVFVFFDKGRRLMKQLHWKCSEYTATTRGSKAAGSFLRCFIRNAHGHTHLFESIAIRFSL